MNTVVRSFLLDYVISGRSWEIRIQLKIYDILVLFGMEFQIPIVKVISVCRRYHVWNSF